LHFLKLIIILSKIIKIYQNYQNYQKLSQFIKFSMLGVGHQIRFIKRNIVNSVYKDFKMNKGVERSRKK
jgi:hypothetical protein